ncbi:hypothetical protein COCNU_02G017610 [Cocos nucifera]|uniref:Uncharacterized protein n=1 Tax=Cocos nucifera TaxID=13894 RepID=A0A8K0I0S4_COCNU|nr:hypothetical protein COCNU_02G017610 [Cocos nucifera]
MVFRGRRGPSSSFKREIRDLGCDRGGGKELGPAGGVGCGGREIQLRAEVKGEVAAFRLEGDFQLLRFEEVRAQDLVL